MIPPELRYTDKHEWIADSAVKSASSVMSADSAVTSASSVMSADSAVTSASSVRVGITDFAQDALGDIVYVDLPEVGSSVEAGQPFGEVESTKSASEIYAPVSGTVAARNEALKDSPELVNAEPYGGGWLIEIEPSDPSAVAGLLDAAGYAALIEQG